MSAWRVGADSVPTSVRTATSEAGGGAGGGAASGAAPGASSATLEKLNTLSKWIPGDTLALYVTAVTAFSSKAHAQPSVALLVIGIAAAPVMVVLSAFAKSGKVPRQTLLPALLAAGAFAIWSVSVPFSGWQRIGVVRENQAGFAVAAAAVAVAFGLLAEGATKRWGGGPQ